MEKHKKLRIIFYLSLPLLTFFLFGLLMIGFMGHSYGIFLQYIFVFLIAFISIFIAQFLVLYKKVMPQFTEMNILQKSLKDQESGAKMLIRRDLELTRANERLRRLDVAKSNFISVAAHQLRTPLTVIKWTIDMILDENLGPLTIEQRGFLMKGYESNERMIVLVNDMLVADRAESNKLQYQFAPIQILDLIDNVLYEISIQADEKNITIELTGRDDSLPHITVDTEKIRAVLQNLFENAIKYTPEGGKIQVIASTNKNFVKIAIKDTGIGIPEEQQKNIFSRFFRAPNAIKTQTDGSGLGLFIAKSIVEKHGGKIWFESKQNQGTTFYFTIPVTN